MVSRRQPAAKQRRGVLTVEWILLITVLVIGIIAGLGAVRNAILSELNDLANAIQALSPAPTPTPTPIVVAPGDPPPP